VQCLLEGDGEQEAGQLRPQAAVHAGAEGDVPVAAPVEVDAVGVREDVGVPVGRPVADGHGLARRDLHAGDLDRPRRHAPELVDGRVRAEQLLDRAGHGVGLGPQALLVGGVLREVHQGVDDAVDARVAAGQQQVGAEADRLLDRHRGAVDVPRRERREDVVARLRTALLQQPGDVGLQLVRRRAGEVRTRDAGGEDALRPGDPAVRVRQREPQVQRQGDGDDRQASSLTASKEEPADSGPSRPSTSARSGPVSGSTARLPNQDATSETCAVWRGGSTSIGASGARPVSVGGTATRPGCAEENVSWSSSAARTSA
jgi:hypothetical protein